MARSAAAISAIPPPISASTRIAASSTASMRCGSAAGAERFDGVASFGRRPTFDNGAPLLEVFLFDFKGDLYGADARRRLHRLHPRRTEVRRRRRADPADGRRQRPRPRARWPPRPTRFRSSERSVEQDRKAEDARGRTISSAMPRLAAEQARTKAWLVRYNAALALPVSRTPRAAVANISAMSAQDAVIRPPFFCDYRLQHPSRRRRVPELQLRHPRRRRSQRSATAPRSDRRSRSTPPTIRAMPRRGATASNSAGRCGSAAMSGSAAAPSSCPASRSATAP